ncbi:MAG: FtsX-like permease family protein [Luteitalea sp.]|nr:FtsX-like permease family protein [Luteitalea sp.]
MTRRASSSGAGSSLPFVVRAMLRWLLDRDGARTVMNDLQELYERRRTRDGNRAATAWLHRQVAWYPYHLLANRFRATTARRRSAFGAGTTDDSRSGEPMESLLRDLRYSVRSLARTPVLTATIILTVGLGIGATTAIFGLIDAVMLRPLPYAAPGQLVRIYTDSPPNLWPLSVADYLALEDQQTSFQQIAGYTNEAMTFNRGDVAERVRGRLVTWRYFSLLGVSPLHGRTFTSLDGAPGRAPVVVLSHGFWIRHLGGKQNAIGQTIRLDGTEHTVVGVLPPRVGPLEHGRDFFAAVQWEPPPRKGPFFITALGRLREGTERPGAIAELRAINRRMFPLWQTSWQDQRASWGMTNLKDHVIGDVGPTLVIVFAAVGFVLLIACTNATNLLVARVTRRQRELAVRRALGASRGRLLQHLLLEAGLLALGAAAVGLALTLGALELLTSFGDDYLPRTQEVGLSGPVLWCLAALTAGSALLIGLVPSLHGTRSRLDEVLRASGRSSTDAVGARRFRRLLVGAQFAVATPLLIAAGLLVGSLAELRRVDLGFNRRNLLTAAILLPEAQYPSPTDVIAFADEATRRVEALPGVQAVAFADGRPPNEVSQTNNFDLEDHPTPHGQSQPAVPWVGITREYFEVLGLPLIRGRLFDERDEAPDTLPVVVVDRAWAERFFPNQDALGRRFRSGGCTDCPWTTVVGIVGEAKYVGLDKPDQGTVYELIANFQYLMVRTAVEPTSILPSIRQTIGELDRTVALSNVATMEEAIEDSLDVPRYLSLLVSAFAAIALLLSVIGVYGVMSHFVQQHTKDIGIRMALGGRPSDVLRLVVGQGMHVVVGGLVVGIGGALVLTRFMSSLLFGVGTTDLLIFVTVSAMMLSVAMVACLIPAQRAVGLDPATVLREE